MHRDAMLTATPIANDFILPTQTPDDLSKRCSA
jgi:hypothetical protein